MADGSGPDSALDRATLLAKARDLIMRLTIFMQEQRDDRLSVFEQVSEPGSAAQSDSQVLHDTIMAQRQDWEHEFNATFRDEARAVLSELYRRLPKEPQRAFPILDGWFGGYHPDRELRDELRRLAETLERS
jgi:hypothetical protein